MNVDMANAGTRTLGQEEKADFVHFGPYLHYQIVWRVRIWFRCVGHESLSKLVIKCHPHCFSPL